MSTAASSAATNASGRKPSLATAALPTSTGTTAAGSVGGRAAISHARARLGGAGEISIVIKTLREQRTENRERGAVWRFVL